MTRERDEIDKRWPFLRDWLTVLAEQGPSSAIDWKKVGTWALAALAPESARPVHLVSEAALKTLPIRAFCDVSVSDHDDSLPEVEEVGPAHTTNPNLATCTDCLRLAVAIATSRAACLRVGLDALAPESGGPPPNPGSVEAGRLGCRCPVLDNAHGKGHLGGYLHEGHYVFVTNGECPLHGSPSSPSSAQGEG